MSVVVRTRVRVQGTVQGVGFRPFIYRLAHELGLTGWVLNDAEGVLLEAEGPAGAVEELVERISAETPPLAVVERVVPVDAEPLGEPAFTIRESQAATGRVDAPVTPDTATCPDCLRELFDPADRRYRYPFINCTNCGPRFTIVRGVPYDRPLTTMAAFSMCPVCQAEYDDPADRRFHAQPNACPECGPQLSRPLDAVVSGLGEGQIVAVKGIGGYHLACRAADEMAVARLRAGKHREDKPFALMVGDLAAAERLVDLDGAARELMAGPERPIVLAPRRPEAGVAPSVAPGAPELGVMLAYSPLHHLLLEQTGVLVMTSGNLSDEPIAFRDDDARERLAGIADVILSHDREIATRTDDSVRRVVTLGERSQGTFLRRSRGYVPASLPLPSGGTPVPLLACGAEQKNTFCLARGERAWVSHHIGDLENFETLRSFTDGIAHLERLFDVTPEVLVHDLHPEYLSTKYALEREGVELVGVQHHHAHLAACLAEFGLEEPAVAAIFDGTGYGTDGTIWGGELLFGDCAGFERAGFLLPVPMPGGARAVREPWRMACAWLDASVDGDPALPGPLAGQVDSSAWSQVLALSRRRLNAPMTTSAGRLFDAVAALCGVRARVNYEGQAAIELEAVCDPAERGAYRLDGLDPRPVIRAIAQDVRRGIAVGTIAARFHHGLAAAIVEACCAEASARGVQVAVLSGGVFQNRRLLEDAAAGLDAAGLRVLTPLRLPAGDGGIAFGQAAVAATHLRGKET